jgi:hypothetical protein
MQYFPIKQSKDTKSLFQQRFYQDGMEQNAYTTVPVTELHATVAGIHILP